MARDLEQRYDELNLKYFANELPKPKLQWTTTKTRKEIAFTEWDDSDGTKIIRIALDKHFRPYEVLWEAAMLHEMIHIKQRADLPHETYHTGHAEPFYDELHRLMRMGAFDKLL